MATEVRFRRGTTAQHAAFTGALAEITVDTTKKTAVVHDGATPGGFPLALATSVADTMKTSIYDPQGKNADAFDRANHTGAQPVSTVTGLSEAIKGFISPRFNLAQNLADPDNDIDFPAGTVASEQATPLLMTHAAATAQLDVAYGVGNGGRFDSLISDGTWHCFIIGNGAIVSRGFSKSLDPTTQPNWPAGFTHYRRVASWIRSGGVLRRIIQLGSYFWHSIRSYDVSVTDPGTAAVTRTLSVPTGIPVIAFGKAAVIVNPASNVNTRFLLLTALRMSDADPASSGGTVTLRTPAVPTATAHGAQESFAVETNTSGQIRSRMNLSEPALSIQIITEGWIDYRGAI